MQDDNSKTHDHKKVEDDVQIDDSSEVEDVDKTLESVGLPSDEEGPRELNIAGAVEQAEEERLEEN